MNHSGTPVSGDPMLFCWNFWWIAGWLNGAHPLLRTEMLYYPFGAQLTYHSLSFANGFFAFPLLQSTNYIFTYNFLLLLHSLLTGFGTFFLARYLGASGFPAFAAACIAILWPARLSHLTAHLNVAGTGWIPWTYLSLLKSADERGFWYVLPAAAGVFLIGTTGWHLLMGFLLISVFLFPFAGISATLHSWRKPALSIFLGGVFLLPLVLPMIHSHTAFSERADSEKQQYSISPRALVNPPDGYPVNRLLSRKDPFPFAEARLETTGYSGLVLIALCLWGLFSGDKRIRRWILATGTAALFSFGPELVLGHWSIPLPYHLFDSLPFLALGRTPGRFYVCAGIPIGIAAALILTRTNRISGALRIAVIALMIFDFIPPAIPSVRVETPEIYRNLPPGNPVYPAVLEIPADWRNRNYQFYQITHKRPITGGFIARMPVSVFRRMVDLPLLSQLADPKQISQALCQADPCLFNDLVALLKVGVVCIHKNRIDPRLTLSGADLAQRIHAQIIDEKDDMLVLQPVHQRNSVGCDVPASYYLRHWFHAEHWSDQWDNVHWMDGREGTIAVFLPRGYFRLHLNILSAPQRASMQNVEIYFNHRRIHVISITRWMQWYSVDTLVSSDVNTDYNVLQIRADSIAAPSEIPNSGNPDTRKLSIAAAGLRFERN